MVERRLPKELFIVERNKDLTPRRLFDDHSREVHKNRLNIEKSERVAKIKGSGRWIQFANARENVVAGYVGAKRE